MKFFDFFFLRSAIHCVLCSGYMQGWECIHVLTITSSSSIGTTTPCWVLACSTVVKPSQQEGFLQSAVASSTSNPQLGGPVIRTFNSHHNAPPASETTQANPSSGRWNYGPRILPKVATSTSLLGSFTYRNFTTCDRRLYFASEGRRTEDFFRPKNPTASAGFEPSILGTKGQHATSRPPKPPLTITAV